MIRRAISRVYHLVDESNLSSIERDGLLCTSRLLKRAGVRGDECARLERQQRRARTRLPDGVIIRDQVPMPPGALSRCIVDGTTPEEWYALTNSMVFFWIDPGRLARQARACRPWPQLMLAVNAQKLLDRHAARAFVTPFNVGNAMRRAALRGRASFVPLAAWMETGWVHESRELKIPMRAASHRPVELAVLDAVPEMEIIRCVGPSVSRSLITSSIASCGREAKATPTL